jgi:hypothetical protein
MSLESKDEYYQFMQIPNTVNLKNLKIMFIVSKYILELSHKYHPESEFMSITNSILQIFEKFKNDFKCNSNSPFDMDNIILFKNLCNKIHVGQYVLDLC